MVATVVRAAKLGPAAIAGLGRAQWQALLRGLSFDRESRTPTVEEFLAGLIGRQISEAAMRK